MAMNNWAEMPYTPKWFMDFCRKIVPLTQNVYFKETMCINQLISFFLFFFFKYQKKKVKSSNKH